MINNKEAFTHPVLESALTGALAAKAAHKVLTKTSFVILGSAFGRFVGVCTGAAYVGVITLVNKCRDEGNHIKTKSIWEYSIKGHGIGSSIGAVIGSTVRVITEPLLLVLVPLGFAIGAIASPFGSATKADFKNQGNIDRLRSEDLDPNNPEQALTLISPYYTLEQLYEKRIELIQGCRDNLAKELEVNSPKLLDAYALRNKFNDAVITLEKWLKQHPKDEDIVRMRRKDLNPNNPEQALELFNPDVKLEQLQVQGIQMIRGCRAKLLLKVHPDKTELRDATPLCQKLHSAFDTLSQFVTENKTGVESAVNVSKTLPLSIQSCSNDTSHIA